MAQQNLSAVLYSQGDLRLVGRLQLGIYIYINVVLSSVEMLHGMLLHFLCTQENRPIPEPGPNGMAYAFE